MLHAYALGVGKWENYTAAFVVKTDAVKSDSRLRGEWERRYTDTGVGFKVGCEGDGTAVGGKTVQTIVLW